jgi:hypothetical protein
MRRRKQQRLKEKIKWHSEIATKNAGHANSRRANCVSTLTYPFFIVLIVELNGYESVFGGSRATAACCGGAGGIRRYDQRRRERDLIALQVKNARNKKR